MYRDVNSVTCELHLTRKALWQSFEHHSWHRKNQCEKRVKLAASDIEEDGNLSVEEVLTENQEETEEIGM